MGDTKRTWPIVLFSARYLPSVGGVEFFTANLGEHLASQGREVIVVTTEPASSTSQDVRRTVGDGTMEVLRLDSFGPVRMPFARRNARNRALLTRLEDRAPFHALINTRFYDLSTQAARLCRRMGVRPVLIDHGTGYIKFESRVLSFASKTAEHAITANLKRYPVDYYGVSQDASRWLRNFGITSCGEIHNALDSAQFASQASDRDFRVEFGIGDHTVCIAYAARLLADKGADVMLEAARALRENQHIHFFLAGTGPLEDEVREASRELPNLDYVGMLNHADLAALLSTCDVFCLPTRYSEGLPTSLLEAAACSCALVSSHAGGVDEIIPTQDHGVILKHAEATDLVRALMMLTEDPDRLRMLQQTAREFVSEQFSWDHTVSELLAAFDRAEQGW